MSRTAGYRDLSRLSTTLQVGLGLYALIALAAVWSEWLQIELLSGSIQGQGVSDAAAEANDDRQAVVAGLYFLVYLGTAILFLRWTYLACRNARSFRARGMRITPGWAVGWYFVPIATLWKPYEVLKETFMASDPGADEEGRSASHPAIMPLWWALWLVSGALGRVASRLSVQADTAEELLNSSWMALVSNVLDLPLGVVVILLVSTMQRWQSERSRLASASVFD